MHSGTLTIEADTEIAKIKPTVEIDDQVRPDVHCMMVEDSEGVVPGKAVLVQSFGQNATIPNTLHRHRSDERPLEYGSRVRVYSGSTVYHLGQLMVRNDAGGADRVSWVSYDDSILLGQVPIRGALVRDESIADGTNEFQFVPRYEARFNPSGLWNCVGAWVGGSIRPIFSNVAELGKNYERPDEAFVGELEDGKIVPWTPRRALLYLQYLATLTPYGDIKGIDPTTWRAIYSSSRISWDEASIHAMNGIDPALEENDPLDRKLGDVRIRGDRLLFAIQKILDEAGTHGQRLKFDAPTGVPKRVQTTKVHFYERGFSGLGGSGGVIRCIRGGSILAHGTNTAFDFEVYEDATHAVESALVEGDPVKVETSVDFEGGAATGAGNRYTEAESNSRALRSAWTDVEEIAFLQVVRGVADGDTTSTPRYAKIPPAQGYTENFSSWTDADGEGTPARPLARANTPEAVQIARAMFPRVFRAFYLDNAGLSTALDGQGGEYSDADKYARLDHKRPILAEQLQFLLRDLSGSDNQENWLRTQYPVRIQVTNPDGEIDAPLGTGVRVTGDGLLWIDGLGEAVDRVPAGVPAAWCMYSGSLYNYNSTVEMKSLTLNIAFPMDHRVSGYVDIGAERASTFSESFREAIHGLPMEYVDAPGEYMELHQVASEPGPDTAYYLGSTTETTPLTRLLPPGSEATSAAAAARRRLEGGRHPRRKTSWKLSGIRPEWSAGNWVTKVEVIGGAEADVDYVIESAVTSVVYDFEKNQTVVGGLLSEVAGA